MASSEAAARPTACIVIGMAGSGKTTFMQRLVAELGRRQRPAYVVNLDPAVANVPYRTDLDIRDTVDYRSVMKTYKLGPNGAIVTSLNLFATRFDQVISYIEGAERPLDYVLVDTPGQIEVFTWSASGQIITESLASSVPTVIVYVVDTPRAQDPTTFMSNMTYACSIMYKTRLPLLIVFNKIDVVGHGFAQDWMRDVEAFEEALQAEKTFRTTLTRSLAFVMDEFYKNIKTCGVSSVTGIGIDDFFAKLDECAGEYERDYRPFLQERLRERNEQIETLKETRLKQAQEQMGKPDVVVDATAEDRENPEEKDEEEDGSDLEPFDNFDYEQDRRDYEEYMAQLRERESSQ